MPFAICTMCELSKSDLWNYGLFYYLIPVIHESSIDTVSTSCLLVWRKIKMHTRDCLSLSKNERVVFTVMFWNTDEDFSLNNHGPCFCKCLEAPVASGVQLAHSAHSQPAPQGGNWPVLSLVSWMVLFISSHLRTARMNPFV